MVRFPATVRASARFADARALLRRRRGVTEVGIFAVALVAYQLSRVFVMGDPGDAFRHAAHIISWEQSRGLFVELSIQQWLVNNIRFAEALNWFYMYGHWTVTPLFFVWLYRARPRLYPYVRNAFLAANGIALVIFMAFPVAPPRMFSSDGFIDTLHGVSEIDLHGGVLSGWFNPHAAVPSMHFGYAFMIGVVAFLLTTSWPWRIAALCYPLLVFITITGTANHYVVDSLAGGLVIAMGFVVVHLWGAVTPTRRLVPVRVRR